MIKKIGAILLVFSIILIAFFNIEITAKSVLESVNIFYNFVLPYLLPFLFFVPLFLHLGGGYLLAYFIQYPSYYLFGINGYEMIVFICSILSGCPANAIYSEMFFSKEKISDNQAKNLIYFCSFPSMFFILGTLKKYVENISILKIIFLSIISVFFLIFSLHNSNKNFITFNEVKRQIKSVNINYIFISVKSCINNALRSILLIMSSYIFFYIISSIICSVFDYQIIQILLSFLEFSNGSFIILSLRVPDIIKYNFLVFLLGFGGLSIYTQIITCLAKIKIDFKHYFLSKIKHAFLACLFFNIYYILFII